ncbi:MAG: transcription antitermination factor NusB [Candidatus Accumulibacter sp.]|jgi:N utilization substance protein B|nr:transcription antitermination factor NusB [Accumulibacter sp.]
MSGPTTDAGTARPAPRKAVKSPRRRAREFVLQGLYQWLVSANEEASIEAHLADSEGFDKADRDFFTGLLRGVLARQGDLRERLQAYLDRPFAELSPIEAGVLLTGAYELLHCPQTPYRVVINEAIELTKGFGGTDGYKYVNGVLDRLASDVRSPEAAAWRAGRP